MKGWQYLSVIRERLAMKVIFELGFDEWSAVWQMMTHVRKETGRRKNTKLSEGTGNNWNLKYEKNVIGQVMKEGEVEVFQWKGRVSVH